uniref:GRF-type domain-containing protein n=1 Tax=Hordeum vulgare subsp. vulgare TaxID=112509 RepID=A0A8I7BH77_HORVV
MDYEPAKNCGLCGKKAPRWISWSPANPGRRYYSCVEAQHGFVEWHDGPTTPFLCDLLGDLRDKVWMLEEEATQLPTENDVAVLRKELEKKTIVISEIVARCEKKVESQMYKSMIYPLILFLAGFVAGMILS